MGQNLQDHPACLTAAPLKDKYDGISLSGEGALLQRLWVQLPSSFRPVGSAAALVTRLGRPSSRGRPGGQTPLVPAPADHLALSPWHMVCLGVSDSVLAQMHG